MKNKAKKSDNFDNAPKVISFFRWTILFSLNVLEKRTTPDYYKSYLEKSIILPTLPIFLKILKFK